MPTGRPLSLKCPSCKRGMYLHEGRSGEQSPVRIVLAEQRKAWRSTRRGSVLRTLTLVGCPACLHRWWTTLLS